MTPLVGLVLLLTAGAVCGSTVAPAAGASALAACAGAGVLVVAARMRWAGHDRPALAVASGAALALGIGLGAMSEAQAWHPPGLDLADLEHRAATGTLVRIDGVLRRDAFITAAGGVMLDVEIRRVQVGDQWRRTSVGARVTVAGDRAPASRAEWTRGRRVEAPVSSLRRPLPYRNFGVADAERALARQGVRLFGGIKSASLVTATPAAWWEELAARARAHVRRSVASHVADPTAAAVVTAILIGDRSRMPPAVTRGLQHAGVYHVVAISGGNVGVWLLLLFVLPRASGVVPRFATAWLALGLFAFALVVDGGPSVLRAVLVAAVALVARWWDVRAAGFQALAVAAGLQVLLDPLSPYDAGCLLSFGAAATIVYAAGEGRQEDDARRRERREMASRRWRLATRVGAGLAVSALATIAIEIVLLPITASWFNVATAAGVFANVLALPAMAVVQIAGLIVVATAWLLPPVGDVAGYVSAQGVAALLRSADVVALAPWLVREVPPPSMVLLVVYYGSLAATMAAWSRRHAVMAIICGTVLAGSVALTVHGGSDHSRPTPWTWPGAHAWQRASWPHEPWLLVTMLDVGQGDATVLRLPSGETWLVDAGGSMSDSFDVGERVTSRAVWALGHRTLSRVLVSHGHPDHAGGVPAVLRRLRARELLTGIPVPGNATETALSEAARAAGTRERRLVSGESLSDRRVRVDVVHPEAPDWERRRVRNDDSLVLWVRFGDVGILLTGDIGEATEQALAARFVAAPLTVLKVAHHGSASSTGTTLLARTRPALALGSMGRGNAFGHPSPAVVHRLREAGTALLRTDDVGAIQLATNGRVVLVRTATGLAGSLTTRQPRLAWWPATPIPSHRGSPRRVAAHQPRGVLPWP